MDDVPRIRAGHHERARTTDQLAQAFAEGKLTHDEFEERSNQVLASRFLDELDPIVADLGPSVASASSPGTSVDVGHTGRGVPHVPGPRFVPEGRGKRASVALFSNVSRVGTWTVSRQHTSVAVFGATTLDLREVLHTSGEVEISVWAVLGGTQILVTPDTEVVVDGFAILGAFGWMDDEHARPPRNPQGPRVRIRGFTLLGAVGVVRKPLDEHQ